MLRFRSFPALPSSAAFFVGALKAVAPLLVFFLVISSLCHSGKSHGGVIRTVIVLYMFSTFLAAVIAVIASMMFPITLTLAEGASDLAAPEGIVEVLSSLLLNMVSNPVQSIVSANYIGVLVWAVLFGIGLRGASETTKTMFDEISTGLAKVVTWIISFAPFGIMGLVFSTVSENGLSIFTEYGKLLAVLVGSMLFIYFVTNPILVFWCIHKNPYPLIFKCLKKSAITAFFTRSSAANIPINMEACEEMGLDKDTYSRYHPAWRNHQHGRRGYYHHRYDTGNRPHPWHFRRYPECHHLKCPGCSVCLRRIRCSRWFPAAHPDGMFPCSVFRMTLPCR